jgi:hypothetical protein
MFRLVGPLLAAGLLLSSCRKPTPDPTPLFTRLPAAESGLAFNNEIARFENDTFNSLSYDPIYNGAGVGIGDFNRDGRPDVFMAGNKVSSRLFLNRTPAGRDEIRFEDVSEKAGIRTDRWCTGVSVVDLNQDGWPDVYVCVAGPHSAGPLEPGQDSTRRANYLFINEGTKQGGVPRFSEQAAAYGLADTGFSTQAAFFDYDHDGDLDCYILTNALERQGRNVIRPKRLDGSGPSTDRLYENLGFGIADFGLKKQDSRANRQSQIRNPQFKNVSRRAGILAEGYGLGLCITDLNGDGWPDVYCANDFISNDLVWINNGNGTGRHSGFTDRAADLFKHTSYNSMGVDVADVNNDGRQDVMVVDMLPENNERQKMMLIKTNWEYFHLARQQGYQDEYVRNVLQLNLGSPAAAANAGGLPAFAEIGQMAGVFRTDWSWAPLLADLDLDAYRDLVVTNGYRRDITNLDYAIYLNEAAGRFPGAYSNPDFRRETLAKLGELPENKLHAYAFRNRGDLTFEDQSLAWGFTEEAYSNGAAYADFDGDGDLDLVFNNIDGEAGLYRNERLQPGQPAPAHWLRLKLEGPPPNRDAFGATIRLTLPNGQVLLQETNPVRGYLSSVEPVWSFGLGNATTVSGEITWPDGKRQTLNRLAVNQLQPIRYQPDADQRPHPEPPVAPLFTTLDGAVRGLGYRHEETEYQDLMRTPLLPHVFSKNGPGIAVGDANGDGLDDVFIGADPHRPRTLYFQQKDGSFSAKLLGSNELQDLGALFFDADGDGDQDLYVVSGGSAQEGDGPQYQDRLYVNDGPRGYGTGNLVRSQNTLPPITSSGGCVVAADFDRDGDLDLFRGGRVQPGQYPTTPRSYLLRNDGGKGQPARFSDVTPEVLKSPGLVCAALWTDYDHDGWPDLLLAGEWMPLTFFRNEKGILHSQFPIFNSQGWWNSLAAADFDRDGDVDYVVGNLGLNSKYKASPEQPVRLYAGDFDENGRLDPVLTYFLEGKEALAPIRDVATDQMTVLMRKRFTSYTAYARADVDDVLDKNKARVLQASEMRSCLLENRGGGTFALKPLPLPAQIAPVFGIQTGDFNGDGNPDALLVGNSYAAEPYAGRYDAGRGTLLLGDGKGGFSPVPFQQAGLNAEFDAKALARVQTTHGPLFVVGNNNGPVQLLAPAQSSPKTIRLLPTDASALLTHADGRHERVEFYHGSGYLSQSSQVLDVPAGVTDVRVVDSRGRSREAR